jgi:hypothetical protein
LLKSDIVEPIDANARSDNDEPKCAASSTETFEPNRTVLKSDICDP